MCETFFKTFNIGYNVTMDTFNNLHFLSITLNTEILQMKPTKSIKIHYTVYLHNTGFTWRIQMRVIWGGHRNPPQFHLKGRDISSWHAGHLCTPCSSGPPCDSIRTQTVSLTCYWYTNYNFIGYFWNRGRLHGDKNTWKCQVSSENTFFINTDENSFSSLQYYWSSLSSDQFVKS